VKKKRTRENRSRPDTNQVTHLNTNFKNCLPISFNSLLLFFFKKLIWISYGQTLIDFHMFPVLSAGASVVKQSSSMAGQKRHFQPSSCVIDARERSQSMRIQKRQKKLSPKEESELEPVLMAVLDKLSQHKSPETLDELREVLQDLHSLRLQVDPKVVFYHLLLNGALVLDETNSFILPNTNYSVNNTTFRGIVPDEPSMPTHLPFSPYFCDAFLKAVLWIQKLPEPLSIQSLFLQLSELCKFERQVSPSQIINLLLHKNYVSLSSTIGGEEVLTFSFPSPKALGVTCHYPPSVAVN